MDEITLGGRVGFVTWIRVMDYITPYGWGLLYFIRQKHYRNFLSWLLARNPVKSILLKAVRSGKKQENVCKSYIIPAPLLYQYSYTKDILFYFFYFLSQPVKFSCGIHFFGDVRNFVSDHIFNGVFIDAIFFCHTHKMLSSVMWSVSRI